MSDDITIRPCQAGDLPAIRDLLCQLGEVAHAAGDSGLDHLAGLLAKMQADPEVYYNLVALSGEQVAGFLSMIFYQTMVHRGGSSLINELVVDRAARGRGIGRALIAAAVAEARARGVDEVEVSTEQDNHRAREFYGKCGFDEEYVLLGMEFEA